MQTARFAVLTVLTLVAITVSDSHNEVRAQNGSVLTQTTQTILPDGTVITNNEVVAVGQSANNRAAAPSTLKTGLDAAVWDPVQRGPLIAVASETVRPAWLTSLRVPQIGPDGTRLPLRAPQPPETLADGRYRVVDLADYFGRRLVRLNGVSVLAPTEMVVLNTKLGKPDYFANLQRHEKLQMLQASLTTAQWKLLGSENGLGANDLSGQQRDLFLSYLPDPMRITKLKVTGPFLMSGVPDDKPVLLSGSQRTGVRLRLNRTVRFSVPLQGDNNSRYDISHEPIGTEFATLSSHGSNNERDKLFGQPVRAIQPNRLKPQQIDFDAPALRAAISLAGLKTVGELVERIRTTTRTEIFADGRAAKLALWVKSGDTQTIRAGEALRVLCWSLTGAVRYVPCTPKGVFILTEDLEGIGSRLARISDWSQAAQEHASQARGTLQEAIRKQEPLQHIGFAANGSNALDAKASKIVEDGWETMQGRWQGTKMPLSDLSPQQQALVRDGMAKYDKKNYTHNGEHLDLANNGNVFVSVQIQSVLVVPGVGEVRDSGFGGMGSLDSLLPPYSSQNQGAAVASPKLADTASVPANLPLGGALCVSVTTEEEAQKVVQVARECGLKQVWLTLPVAPASGDDAEMAKNKALLVAAITEAEKTKPALKIIAGVRLFSLPSAPKTLPAQTQTAAPKTADDRELTITGELPTEAARRRVANSVAADADPVFARFASQTTREWIAPDAVGLTGRLARRLGEIAAVPGLSGIALLDTAPPGYSLPIPDPRFGRGTDGRPNVGYTLASRAALIRAAGFDPIDIDTTGGNFLGNVDTRLPFFADEERFQFGSNETEPNAGKVSADGQWITFRSKIVTQTLTDLYAPLIAALPAREGGFPVYLQSLDTPTAGNGWFSRWERKNALPRRARQEPGRPLNLYQAAQATSAVSLVDIAYRDYPRPSRPSPFASGAEPVAPSVQFARNVQAQITYSKGAWAGVVLNFSDVSVEKALELIQGIVPPENTAQKPSRVSAASR